MIALREGAKRRSRTGNCKCSNFHCSLWLLYVPINWELTWFLFACFSWHDELQLSYAEKIEPKYIFTCESAPTSTQGMWKSGFHGVKRNEVCLQRLPRIVAFCLCRITLCVGPRLHLWGFFFHMKAMVCWPCLLYAQASDVVMKRINLVNSSASRQRWWIDKVRLV